LKLKKLKDKINYLLTSLFGFICLRFSKQSLAQVVYIYRYHISEFA